jgi:hypothetical protein
MIFQMTAAEQLESEIHLEAAKIAQHIELLVEKAKLEPEDEQVKASLAAAKAEGEKYLLYSEQKVTTGLGHLRAAVEHAGAFLTESVSAVSAAVEGAADEVAGAASSVVGGAAVVGQAAVEPFYKHPLFLVAAVGLGAYLIWGR